jgi:aminopeptidase YwaD
MRIVAAALGAVLLATGCTSEPVADPPAPPATLSTTPTPSPTANPTPTRPPRFDAGRAMRTVRHLAGEIGPRLATGPTYVEAAAYVEERFAAEGYDVRRQSFAVPAGDSWGVPVEGGRSSNVIATVPTFDPAAPYVLVGAHLDTVAVAPGAEDNASGVAVLLELARVLGDDQVVLVAFGGEEPRGPGELHHFGSKAYVAAMSRAERRLLRAMVSLDRVGVGTHVPLGVVVGTSADTVEDLAGTARRLRIPIVVETDAASDHESFADADLPAARIGSTPYAGYHSAGDVPAVVHPGQLDRVGRLVTAWLS